MDIFFEEIKQSGNKELFKVENRMLVICLHEKYFRP